MKSFGNCHNVDELCRQDWVKHPLIYYRAKSRRHRKQPGAKTVPQATAPMAVDKATTKNRSLILEDAIGRPGALHAVRLPTNANQIIMISRKLVLHTHEVQRRSASCHKCILQGWHRDQ